MTPTSTSRRNVVWRIEQLLNAQEALPAPTLTKWQTDTVLKAIEALDEERFADGEAFMMKAERPDLWQAGGAALVTRAEVGQLLMLLQKTTA